MIEIVACIVIIIVMRSKCVEPLQKVVLPGCLNFIHLQMSRFFVEPLVRPIMVQLEDTDNNVRFYACESLYNVIKVNPAWSPSIQQLSL